MVPVSAFYVELGGARWVLETKEIDLVVIGFRLYYELFRSYKGRKKV
jgi:hypothetical protein